QRVDERELLKRLRAETERTFGVSFSSLLRFISDHLLTCNERNLQALLQTPRKEYTDETSLQLQNVECSPVSRQSVKLLSQSLHPGLQETSAAWLTQTAEAALADTEILRELSRLLQLYERSHGGRTDAWFVTDLNGRCIYMNPAAEVFCGIRLLHAWKD